MKSYLSPMWIFSSVEYEVVLAGSLLIEVAKSFDLLPSFNLF